MSMYSLAADLERRGFKMREGTGGTWIGRPEAPVGTGPAGGFGLRQLVVRHVERHVRGASPNARGSTVNEIEVAFASDWLVELKASNAQGAWSKTKAAVRPMPKHETELDAILKQFGST